MIIYIYNCYSKINYYEILINLTCTILYYIEEFDVDKQIYYILLYNIIIYIINNLLTHNIIIFLY